MPHVAPDPSGRTSRDEDPPFGEPVAVPKSRVPLVAVGALALLVGLVAGALIGAAFTDDGEDELAAPTTTASPAPTDEESGDGEGTPCAGALSEAEQALREVRSATEAVSGFDADALRSSIEILDETADELRDAVEECRRAVDR